MSFGQISWIADLLLDDPDEKRRVMAVRSETCMYGNTAGPWGGIGGSAMTDFTMTLITLADGYLVYADERRMGRVRPGFINEVLAKFPHVDPHWIAK